MIDVFFIFELSLFCQLVAGQYTILAI